MTPVFDFVHVRSQFIPPDNNFYQTIAGFTKALEALGGKQALDISHARLDQCLYFMDTGGTEETLLKLYDQRKARHPNSPVLLIAHPGYNSLPASLEVLARLQQERIDGQVLFLKGAGDTQGFSEIEKALNDIKTSQKLRTTNIGLIGDPSNWLVASSPQAQVVEQAWGPKVIPIAIEELTAAMARIPDAELKPIASELGTGATEIKEPTEQELSDVVKVYLALKELIKTHKLEALTLRCFDLVLGLKTTGCYALSRLIDEGLVAGCEGDLVSTVGMLWAQELTGETPWMANPARLDESSNRLTLAHCTVPRKLVDEYGLRSHFESGLGVGLQGRIPNGPVTLLRIGGKAMEKVWLAEGHIDNAGTAEDLCRTQVDIQLSSGHVSELLQNPLGNHLVMVMGHHAGQFQRSHQSISQQ